MDLSYDKYPGRGRGGYSSGPGLGLFQSRFSRASLGGGVPLNLARPWHMIASVRYLSIKFTLRFAQIGGFCGFLVELFVMGKKHALFCKEIAFCLHFHV